MLSSFGADERGRKWDWSARCVGWTALVHDHSRPCRGSELTELHFRLSAKHPDPMSHTSGWEAHRKPKPNQKERLSGAPINMGAICSFV